MAKTATVGKKNTNLGKARTAKQDEFYTQLSDIENELKHYKEHFKGKVVYCNCDDPMKSNFFRYFMLNFNKLGLKKLITTCYKSQDDDAPSQNNSKQAIYLEYAGNKTANFDLKTDITRYNLKGDGDFRSEECINLLKQADIVITNPPFSLFREYVAQLIEHNKKFLIVGSLNAITYKEVFKLIKENKLWLGYGNGAMTFKVPDSYTGTCEGTPGNKKAKLGNICWYTNLDINKRNEDIILYKAYSPKEYPTYDNYKAIEVSKVKDIPMDYYNELGVPITFLQNYNPAQFEIIWTTDRGGDGNLDHLKKIYTRYDAPVVGGEGLYKRIIIKRVK
jgi:hypothetical protein